jgi:hypothetical protein
MASREVRSAVGDAPEKSLEERAAELRAIVEKPSAKERAEAELREVEARIAARKEDEGREAARERCVGISRAVGSVVASIEGDEQNLAAAARAYVAALDRLNARYRQYEGLVAENDALVDRFGIEGAKIPSVVEPNRREGCIAAYRMVEGANFARSLFSSPSVERCEHGVRMRRTYGEVASTEAHRIIEAAGLKPWPELTERQRKIVEAKARDDEEFRRRLAGVPDTSNVPSNVPLGSL